MPEYWADWIHNDDADLNTLFDQDHYLNFTQIDSVSVYSEWMSPRQLIGAVTSDDLGTSIASMHLAFIDTDRERSLGIGNDYPFSPLAEGECLLPERFRKSNSSLAIGSVFSFNFEQGSIIQAAAHVFNRDYLQPGVEPVKVYRWDFNYNCTIKDFKTSNYGKYESKYDDSLMFMELSPFFNYEIQFLPDYLHDREDFVSYLLTDGLIYQYIN